MASAHRKNRLLLSASAIAVALLWSAPAGAAEESDSTRIGPQVAQNEALPVRNLEPRRGETVRERERPELDPLGIHAGSFFIFPSVTLSESYNDNIFADPNNEESDLITTVSPGLTVRSDWGRHALRLSAGVDAGFYADNDDENFVDYNLGGVGILDITRATSLRGEAGYQHLHEERDSADDADGIEPTEYDRVDLGVALRHAIGRFSGQIGAEYQDLDFDNVPAGGGVTNINDDRYRDRVRGTVRIGYEVSPSYEFFVDGFVDRVEYDQNIVGLNYNRDSDGYGASAGVSLDLGGVTFGDVYFGYRERDYDEPSLGDTDGFALGGELTWNVTGLTTVIASASGEIQETTVTDGLVEASGRFVTAFGLRVDHELLRNLILGARINYANQDYEGISREDDVFGGGLNALYMMNRNFQLRAGYSYRERDSDAPGEDFSENLLSLGLRLQY